MPEYKRIRNEPEFVESYPAFARLSSNFRNLLKRMIHREPYDRPHISGILGEFDKEAAEAQKWLTVVNKSIKNSRLMTNQANPSRFAFRFQAFKSR